MVKGLFHTGHEISQEPVSGAKNENIQVMFSLATRHENQFHS